MKNYLIGTFNVLSNPDLGDLWRCFRLWGLYLFAELFWLFTFASLVQFWISDTSSPVLLLQVYFSSTLIMPQRRWPTSRGVGQSFRITAKSSCLQEMTKAFTAGTCCGCSRWDRRIVKNNNKKNLKWRARKGLFCDQAYLIFRFRISSSWTRPWLQPEWWRWSLQADLSPRISPPSCMWR